MKTVSRQDKERRRSRRGVASALLGALCAVNGATAHETWLLPEDFNPPVDEATQLLMTSGMSFPSLSAGIDRLRLAEAVLYQGGERFSLVPAGATAEALTLSAVPSAPTACAWVALHPRILEIEEADVAHYLEEIGAGDDIWAAWTAQSEPRLWRESYAKLARTYLRTGPGDDGTQCWRETSDARFEILPATNPGVVNRGDSLLLDVFFDDAPLADQAVGLRHENDAEGTLLRSNSKGQLSVSFDKPGRYMIYATKLRPLRDGTGDSDEANWESDFITLTLQVGER